MLILSLLRISFFIIDFVTELRFILDYNLYSYELCLIIDYNLY
jgi:hypothetical protein